MYKKSAKEYRDQFVHGQKSATEITGQILERAKKCDPQIKAFLTILEDRALRKAESLDKRKKEGKVLGKLAGVPIAIKDNMHVKDEISTCGSKFLTNYRALFSATVVRRLEEEDAIIIGKTNLDEFAMGSSTENSAFFPTKNPWNLDCTPGGSSGGSAAAVAARLCPLALGSDTGGSIRQPASLCGIYGFKPTYGRVSRYGLVAFGSSLDQIGPFATNVNDIALTLEIISGHCPKDSTSIHERAFEYSDYIDKHNIKGRKIGVPWDFLKDLNPQVKDNFMSSLEVFKSLGAEIVEVDLSLLKYSIGVYYILATAEASTNLARFDGVRYGVRAKNIESLDDLYRQSRKEGFGPEVKRRIMLGTFVLSSGFHDAYYRKAQQVRALIIQAFKKAFTSCDMILTPSSPMTTFKIGAIHDPLQMYLQDIYTVPANLAGLPAISIPCGFDHEQKPFGLQLTGPQMHDKDVLLFASAFEKSTNYHQQIPPLFA